MLTMIRTSIGPSSWSETRVLAKLLVKVDATSCDVSSVVQAWSFSSEPELTQELLARPLATSCLCALRLALSCLALEATAVTDASARRFNHALITSGSSKKARELTMLLLMRKRSMANCMALYCASA